MPCWFYDRKDLVNTPSARDGISADVEAWYRKEGAKHIIDAGNKLGLYLFIGSYSRTSHSPDLCTCSKLVA